MVGRKDPKFYGGFTTDLSWKNFSLNAIFTYNYGSKRINYLYEGMMSGNGITTAHADELDRWTPEHTNTNVPRALYRRFALRCGRYRLERTELFVPEIVYANAGLYDA